MVPTSTSSHISMILLVLLRRQLYSQAKNESFAKISDPMLYQPKKLSRTKDSFCPSLLNKSPEILRLNNLDHVPSPELITRGWGVSTGKNNVLNVSNQPGRPVFGCEGNMEEG